MRERERERRDRERHMCIDKSDDGMGLLKLWGNGPFLEFCIPDEINQMGEVNVWERFPCDYCGKTRPTGSYQDLNLESHEGAFLR